MNKMERAISFPFKPDMKLSSANKRKFQEESEIDTRRKCLKLRHRSVQDLNMAESPAPPEIITDTFTQEISPTTCRACLTNDNSLLFPLQSPVCVDKTSLPIVEVLDSVTMQKVDLGSKFPSNLCITCLQHITAAYKWIQKYEHNQRILKDICMSETPNVSTPNFVGISAPETTVDIIDEFEPVLISDDDIDDNDSDIMIHEDIPECESDIEIVEEAGNKKVNIVKPAVRKAQKEKPFALKKSVFCKECGDTISVLGIGGHVINCKLKENSFSTAEDKFIVYICKYCLLLIPSPDIVEHSKLCFWKDSHGNNSKSNEQTKIPLAIAGTSNSKVVNDDNNVRVENIIQKDKVENTNQQNIKTVPSSAISQNNITPNADNKNNSFDKINNGIRVKPLDQLIAVKHAQSSLPEKIFNPCTSNKVNKPSTSKIVNRQSISKIVNQPSTSNSADQASTSNIASTLNKINPSASSIADKNAYKVQQPVYDASSQSTANVAEPDIVKQPGSNKIIQPSPSTSNSSISDTSQSKTSSSKTSPSETSPVDTSLSKKIPPNISSSVKSLSNVSPSNISLRNVSPSKILTNNIVIARTPNMPKAVPNILKQSRSKISLLAIRKQGEVNINKTQSTTKIMPASTISKQHVPKVVAENAPDTLIQSAFTAGNQFASNIVKQPTSSTIVNQVSSNIPKQSVSDIVNVPSTFNTVNQPSTSSKIINKSSNVRLSVSNIVNKPRTSDVNNRSSASNINEPTLNIVNQSLSNISKASISNIDKQPLHNCFNEEKAPELKTTPEVNKNTTVTKQTECVNKSANRSRNNRSRKRGSLTSNKEIQEDSSSTSKQELPEGDSPDIQEQAQAKSKKNNSDALTSRRPTLRRAAKSGSLTRSWERDPSEDRVKAKKVTATPKRKSYTKSKVESFSKFLVCVYCSQKINMSILAAHRAECSGPISNSFTCSSCSQAFTTTDMLTTHEVEDHGKKIDHCCTICKENVSHSNWAAHKQKHDHK